MKFTLNGREFEFFAYPYNGSYWRIESENIESEWFPSLLEAQQDAIRHAEQEYNQPSDWADKQTKLFCRE